MHIAINCRSILRKKYTGIGRYTYHLVKSLGEIDPDNEYSLYAKKGVFNLSKRIPRFPSKNFFVKTDRLGLGVEKLIKKFDLYHCPFPDNISVNGGTKIVVTIHDLIVKTYPQGHTQKTIDDTERQYSYIAEKASKIICCSNSTARDLKKYFGVKDEKIAMVYQGVDKNLFYLIGKEEERVADKVLKSHGIREPYILTVGTIEPRKNLENILHAFDKLRTRQKFRGKLVVIGMRGWMSEGIDSLVRKLELKNHILFLGYVTNPELRYFYNKAEALLFPSYYEGFGFPIVEAFCCGTPVVTSNVSSCPEVAQDAALTVDPYDPADIAQAVGRVIEDAELRRTLRERGFRRAGDFNFCKTAKETLNVYQEVYRS